MDWRQRLRDLLLAGGAIASVNCTTLESGGGFPCGNANSDPCICGRPESSADYRKACDQERACQSDGGSFYYYYSVSDGGFVGQCQSRSDAGSDGAGDDRIDQEVGG